jgi:hypothetical protein
MATEPMAHADKVFYVALAVFSAFFGTGLWIVFVDGKWWTGIPLTILGVLGMAASLIERISLPPLNTNFLAVLLVCATFVLGYNIFSQPITKAAITTELIREETPSLPRVLYVGQITVNVQRLSQDNYLQLTIVGFNGSDNRVSISNGLDGFIRYREIIDNQSVDRGALPVPSIDIDASNNPNPGPWSEFWIVLEQRVPSKIASQMARSLSTKGTVNLDLSSLNIWTTRQSDPKERRRLPLWDGVSCQERDGMTVVGKVLNASASSNVKAAGAP